MSRYHDRFENSLIKSFNKFQIDFMTFSSAKMHEQSFFSSKNHENQYEIAFESSNKSQIVKNFHRRDIETRFQKLFIFFDFKNVIREIQKIFINIFDNVIDDYNELQKQINIMKFKINNEFVIKNDVIVFDKESSTSINTSINVVMTKFQNNINSINFVSKFVKSSQKIFAINVFVSHRNQIFFFATHSFDQQKTRNIQYQISNFRSFQKIRKKRSFDADILHQNDEEFSFFF